MRPRLPVGSDLVEFLSEEGAAQIDIVGFELISFLVR